MRFQLTLLLPLLLSANIGFADAMNLHKVSITNTTKAQNFTPH